MLISKFLKECIFHKLIELTLELILRTGLNLL